MKIRHVISTLLCLLAAIPLLTIANGTTAKTSIAQPVDTTLLSSKTFSAAPFTTINIGGSMNVLIINNSKTPTLKLTGDSYSMANSYAAVKNGVLYLSTLKNYKPQDHHQLLATVNTSNLNQLIYSGGGSVTGQQLSGPLTVTASGGGTIVILGKKLDLRNLNVSNTNDVHILGIDSSLLNIQDNAFGKVNLGGTMVLQNLTYNGSGPLSLYWINSSNVHIDGSGKGRVFLAGIAGTLDATIGGATYLDAKYLHAKAAYIKTTDNTRADVWTHCTLNTLASADSTIFYYNDAGFSGNYVSPTGSVIRMTNLTREMQQAHVTPVDCS